MFGCVGSVDGVYCWMWMVGWFFWIRDDFGVKYWYGIVVVNDFVVKVWYCGKYWFFVVSEFYLGYVCLGVIGNF